MASERAQGSAVGIGMEGRGGLELNTMHRSHADAFSYRESSEGSLLCELGCTSMQGTAQPTTAQVSGSGSSVGGTGSTWGGAWASRTAAPWATALDLHKVQQLTFRCVFINRKALRLCGKSPGRRRNNIKSFTHTAICLQNMVESGSDNRAITKRISGLKCHSRRGAYLCRMPTPEKRGPVITQTGV